jgi:hypothetical protein
VASPGDGDGGMGSTTRASPAGRVGGEAWRVKCRQPTGSGGSEAKAAVASGLRRAADVSRSAED